MSIVLNQLDSSVRYSLFAIANLLLLIWTYKVVASAKEGWTRFVWSTPLFVLCYLMFTLFDVNNPVERSLAVHVLLNYLWLCPWKLLAFSMNRGCLTKSLESGSLSAFTVSLLLNVNVAFEAKPVASVKKDDDASSEAKGIIHAHDDVRFSVVTYKGKALLFELFYALCKVLGKLLLMLMAGYVYAKTEQGTFYNSVACGWFLYSWGCGIQDVSLFISLLVVNIKLDDSFDQPYRSDSFSDFWARRWNRVMATQLRDLCYDPVVEGRWIASREYFAKREKPFIRRMIGIALTFLASALIHWVILWGVCVIDYVPIRYMSLFILSSFMVGFELLLKVLVRKSMLFANFAKRIGRVPRILFVHFSFLWLGHVFAFPPTHSCGFTDKAFEPMIEALKYLSIL